MTTTDLAPAASANRPPTKAALPISPKVRQAIELMVTKGTPWNEAAPEVGLTNRAMRMALDKPHVTAFLRARKDVFRIHASAANIHRLCEIRDAADNMPAVNAIKALEQIGEDEGRTSGSAQQAPGLVIVVATGGGSGVEANQLAREINAKRSLTKGEHVTDEPE